MLIEFVVATHRSGDAEMLHQHTAGAGVFSQHQMCVAKHRDSAWGHVVEISHWGWNNI